MTSDKNKKLKVLITTYIYKTLVYVHNVLYIIIMLLA